MAQITCFNSQTATGTGTTVSPVFGTTPTSGNALVYVVTTGSSSTNTLSTLTQTGCNPARVANASQAIGSMNIEVWVAPGVSGAGTTPTFTFGSSQNYRIIMFEVSGVISTSLLVDVATGNTNSSASSPTTAAITTATLSNKVEVLICGIVGSSSISVTAGTPTGYTAIASPVSAFNASFRIYADTVAAESVTTSVSGSPTLGIASFVIGLRCSPNKIALRNGTTVTTANVTSGTNATGTITLTMPKRPIRGNIVYVGTCNTTTIGVTTNVICTGISFTRDEIESSVAPAVTIWRGEVAAVTPSSTITVTSGAVETIAAAGEFFGLRTGPLDKHTNSSGTGTAISTGTTGTTTQADELAIAVLADTTKQNPGSSYTLLFNGVAAVTLGMSLSYKILTATGTAVATGGQPAPVPWSGAIATYKEGSPPAGSIIQDFIRSGGVIPYRR